MSEDARKTAPAGRYQTTADMNLPPLFWHDLTDVLAYGDQSGKIEPLQEAASAFREALKERPRDKVPLDWALTKNNLGNALAILGAIELDLRGCGKR
jgi:hypothetical protein